MIKRGDLISEEEILFLEQLMKSIEEAQLRLNKAYNIKDEESLKKLKKYILDAEERLLQVLR